MELSGNTILITGGTSGIGLELAIQLSKRRNTVLVTGRDPQKLRKLQHTLPGVHSYQSDVSDPAAIVSLYQRVTNDFPDLNVLMNNAGMMRMLSLNGGHGVQDIGREIEINLLGPVRMVEQFLPFLTTKPHAAVINVSSGLAFVPLPSAPIYCATKAALHSYTPNLATDGLQIRAVTMTEGWIVMFQEPAPLLLLAGADEWRAAHTRQRR